VITFNGKKLLPELTLVIFSRSALPYAKGTSTRLIRLISIGGGVLFLGGGGRFISFASIGWLFYAVVRLVVVQSYVPVLKKKKLDLYIAIVILITLS
ncbi:hypothetical protein, partial [Salmonella enterica]|uniref:hypothetical protein n=1 Tax=Salmonella enterica TaxID=28901 RepID=UPI000B069BC5